MFGIEGFDDVVRLVSQSLVKRRYYATPVFAAVRLQLLQTPSDVATRVSKATEYILSGEGNVVLFALHDVELLLSDLPLLPAIMFVDIAGEFDAPVTFVGDIQHCDGEFVQENVGGVDIAKPLVVLQQTLDVETAAEVFVGVPRAQNLALVGQE